MQIPRVRQTFSAQPLLQGPNARLQQSQHSLASDPTIRRLVALINRVTIFKRSVPETLTRDILAGPTFVEPQLQDCLNVNNPTVAFCALRVVHPDLFHGSKILVFWLTPRMTLNFANAHSHYSPSEKLRPFYGVHVNVIHVFRYPHYMVPFSERKQVFPQTERLASHASNVPMIVSTPSISLSISQISSLYCAPQEFQDKNEARERCGDSDHMLNKEALPRCTSRIFIDQSSIMGK
ncbi:uncharacterized protein FOMMEDRAFT_155480 [Fomitiporia mediterranea MF3/22]|uniref:uncharacterized protein n=1 Tax=Fomitiporia mediterranea (strain MF3/22) TaxID=694068 RepID=UPI0004408A27|nr:uncharacterized protein FOMMEDRAFT_155480 [Fomitiporia mediterranea MF3/22]EJD04348.1 hypothetical protein FOMMEDRAFT_155480 [Fomitiporia mediterranea MF3/22]